MHDLVQKAKEKTLRQEEKKEELIKEIKQSNNQIRDKQERTDRMKEAVNKARESMSKKHIEDLKKNLKAQ